MNLTVLKDTTTLYICQLTRAKEAVSACDDIYARLALRESFDRAKLDKISVLCNEDFTSDVTLLDFQKCIAIIMQVKREGR